jgi:hypothetical protein
MKHTDEFWETYKFCSILQANSRNWPRKRTLRRREEYGTEKFQRCTNERTWSQPSLVMTAANMVSRPCAPGSARRAVVVPDSDSLCGHWPMPMLMAGGSVLGTLMLLAMRDVADVIAILFPF